MKVQTSMMETVMQTELPLPLLGRGKVRDIYEAGPDRLLVVSTDRLSAFDVILPNPIPYKGAVLTQISAFWFDYFGDSIPHHLITVDVDQMGLAPEILEKYGALLRGRTMLVKRARPLTIECVVRGYVTGSGWKDYLKTGAVCGHKLPEGLKQCARLTQPIFTPATKETEGHDINIDINQAIQRDGEAYVREAERIAIDLYTRGREYADTKGILIADTKFEFGVLDGRLILIDEVMTPDSSRFWPKDLYEEGHDQPSFDKQIVRNHLEESGWAKTPPAPVLPDDVVQKTSQAYRDVYQRLAGRELQ